jgi:hypothetical protein
MANIEKQGVSWLQVILDGSGDWISSQALLLKSLKFQPSAAGDKLVLYEVVPDVDESLWPKLVLSSNSGDTVGCLFNSISMIKVMIDYSACIFTDINETVITFEFV